MASDTVTARAEPGPRRRGFFGSALSRTILALNLLALFVLVAGSLILNEFRQGLILTRQESLTSQAEVLADVIAQNGTIGEPQPALVASAYDVLQRFVPPGQRARLYDDDGQLVADSYLVSDAVEVRPLPPARRPGERPREREDTSAKERRISEARAALRREVALARTGLQVANLRRSETGERVVSVSVPVQRVQAVLGVLTLEAGDVDAIVAAQRMALVPFILIAVAVILVSAFLLNQLVAQPVQRLAHAADRVRLARARAISLPDLSEREDEVGDLARSLEAMTDALSQRMNAIERFAADVAHEIRNPLTSIGSAVETLDIVRDDSARARLTRILKNDVGRLDRLITDISNASRLDAELQREPPRPFDLARLLQEICAFYGQMDRLRARVRFEPPEGMGEHLVSAREGPLNQVFRNLIDNAVSFSAEGGEVRLSLARADQALRVCVEDDGPGIPPDNLETVFQRFYTSRPAGAAFGGNSGLGLSIARQIVEAHGGRIWAENRTGPDEAVLGARFVVELPAARP